MQYYNMVLPETAIKTLEEYAEAAYVPPRTLLRVWVMQRLEAEKKERDAIGGNLPGTTPNAGTTTTQKGSGHKCLNNPNL